MGYYRGDYYRGDYYRGDPGIFSSIGKFLGGVAKTAVGLLPGPVGAIARGITNLPRQQAQIGPSPGLLGAPQLTFGPALPLAPLPMPVDGSPQLPTMLPSGALINCQLKGFRPNKSGYWRAVQRGNPAAGAIWIPKKSVCVKTRRLNVANPRALRRSIRRAQGFAKLARRVLTFVSAKAPKGRGKFKRKR